MNGSHEGSPIIPYSFCGVFLVDFFSRILNYYSTTDESTSVSDDFSHALQCNLLTTMLRPNYEKPLDYAKDLLDRDITLFTWDYGHLWKQLLVESAIPDYRELGHGMVISDDWDHFYEIAETEVHDAGTHAMMSYVLFPNLKNQTRYGKWWRSKEKVSGESPFGSWLANKKWHMNDVSA